MRKRINGDSVWESDKREADQRDKNQPPVRAEPTSRLLSQDECVKQFPKAHRKVHDLVMKRFRWTKEPGVAMPPLMPETPSYDDYVVTRDAAQQLARQRADIEKARCAAFCREMRFK